MKKKLLLASLLIILGTQGCGMWGDFTTYFNTYYNASLIFEESQQDIAQLRENLFEFKEKPISPKTSKNLDKVIEKCSAILQFHAESSYFEDALFMIGQAFYWKGQYAKALRKFKELASIKESEFALQNKLWMGKTMLQMRDFDKGYALLEQVKKEALANEDDETLTETYITQIRYQLYQDNYSDAIELISQLMDYSNDDELKADVTYQLGRIYLELNEREKALQAFQQVQEFEPTFDIEFNSLLEIAKLKKELGHEEESLDLLYDLSANEKYEELWDKVDLEIAAVLEEQGNYEDALSIYQDIDTTYQRTKSAGIAAFNAGKILAEQYNLYDSAMIYFDRTSAADAPPEMKLEARKWNKVIGDYINLDEKLDEQYKQLSYLLDPATFERDSLIYVEYLRQDSIKKAEAKLSGGQSRSRTRNNYATSNTFNKKKQKVMLKPKKPSISADSLKTLISETEFEMGNLFFGELNVPDSAYFYYSNSIEHNPNTLNKPKILYAIGNYYLTINDSLKADSLFNYIYDNYKYDRIINEAARKIGKPLIDFDSDPAEPVYIEAEKHYYAGNYDSAITKMINIRKLYPNSQYAAQGLYTAGFILENELNNPDSAASLYDTLLIKYRNTEFTKAVAKKLTFYKQLMRHKMDSVKHIQDSIKAANAPKDSSALQDTAKHNAPKSLQEILKQQDDEKIKSEEKSDKGSPLFALNRKSFYLNKLTINYFI